MDTDNNVARAWGREDWVEGKSGGGLGRGTSIKKQDY